MNRHRWVAPSALVAAAAAAVLLSRGASPLTAEPGGGPPSNAEVYVYPEKLTPKDKLSFGPGNEQKKTIPIKRESTLIYVDLAPDARFAHPTQCILISTDGARVVNGNWWLILNGKPLFRDAKAFKVDFPIKLSGK
jgi:hypothetical protein